MKSRWRERLDALLVEWSNDLDLNRCQPLNTTTSYVFFTVFFVGLVWAGTHTVSGHNFMGYDSMAILAWLVPWFVFGIAVSELSRLERIDRVQYWLLETLCSGFGTLFLFVLAAHSKGVSALIPASMLMVACMLAAPIHRITIRNPALVCFAGLSAVVAFLQVPSGDTAASVIVAVAGVASVGAGLVLGTESKRRHEASIRMHNQSPGVGAHAVNSKTAQLTEARRIGRYELIRLIGRGGMGDVWQAHDLAIGSPVALKLLRPRDTDHTAVARFQREVHATVKLTHPNTVRVTDCGITDDGIWYYVMELLRGETLRQLVLRRGPLPVDSVAHLAARIARALAEAHDHSIVHRDVSPSNIFIARQGGEQNIPKLIDFGIAKVAKPLVEDLTREAWVGTPGYAAPEVLDGLAFDARADLYSLGATLYFALTGLRFNSLSAEEPNSPEGSNPHAELRLHQVPEEIVTIVMQCLSRSPSARPRYARDVAVVFEASLDAARRNQADDRAQSLQCLLHSVASSNDVTRTHRPDRRVVS